MLLFIKRSYLRACCIAIFCFTSCTRDNEEMFLPSAEITIYAPLANAEIRTGDTIYIDGLATSETGLHGYELAIRKPGQPNLYFQHFHDHTDSLLLKDKWKNIVTQAGDLELMISVILDHEDHRKNVIIPLQVRN